MSKSKPLRWLHPKSDGQNTRDHAPAASPAPATTGNDGCCMCPDEATCSTGGDKYCATHCPNREHH